MCSMLLIYHSLFALVKRQMVIPSNIVGGNPKKESDVDVPCVCVNDR